jgi:hypothetical protein
MPVPADHGHRKPGAPMRAAYQPLQYTPRGNVATPSTSFTAGFADVADSARHAKHSQQCTRTCTCTCTTDTRTLDNKIQADTKHEAHKHRKGRGVGLIHTHLDGPRPGCARTLLRRRRGDAPPLPRATAAAWSGSAASRPGGTRGEVAQSRQVGSPCPRGGWATGKTVGCGLHLWRGHMVGCGGGRRGAGY